LDIGFSNAAAGRKTYGDQTFAKSPRPGARAKCSAWAKCLGICRATAFKPDRCLDGAERLESQGSFANSVHFTGWQSPENVFKWYEVADILVTPSRYEPFGMVILEGCMGWPFWPRMLAAL
jgi:glycosyltransferase involved in cell wall biosynthesis